MEDFKKFLDLKFNIFFINDYFDGWSVHQGTMYCKKTLFRNVKTEVEAVKLAMNYAIEMKSKDLNC